VIVAVGVAVGGAGVAVTVGVRVIVGMAVNVALRLARRESVTAPVGAPGAEVKVGRTPLAASDRLRRPTGSKAQPEQLTATMSSQRISLVMEEVATILCA